MALEFNEQDLLYNLAYECEGYFDQLLESAQKLKLDVGAIEICADFQQRFAMWTAYLGVLARKSQCLDTRLHNLPELQDLVARLLDILRRSLKNILAQLASQKENELLTTSDIGRLPRISKIQTAALKAIDDTITRLNRLGITIRQSSSSKIDTRAKKFIAGHNMESFACLCVNAVQALYPGASQGLKDNLSESMISRYARMSFFGFRKHNLEARREALLPIEEIPSDKEQTNAYMNPSSKKMIHPAIYHLQRAPNAPTMSDLSSVDIQQIIRGRRRPDEASTKFYKTSSIQVKQGNYPQPPGTDEGNNILACQWCGEPLIRKELSETDWRQHIDRDLKPYICLSEECLDTHSAYPTFNEWYRHMELHDRRWYQKMYLISGWVCPLCGPSNSSYNNSDALYSHLTESHSDEFSSTELQTISRQSKVEQSRAWNDCLLCCFTIEERKSKYESTASKRQSRQQKQETVKSPRKSLETTGPDHPSLDLELSGTSSDSDNAVSHQQRKQRQERSNAAARHIAAHLQVLMLLTLRFAALQSDDKELNDDLKSDSVDVDEDFSIALENSDEGRLSHLSALVDAAMKGTDGEKNEETVEDSTRFLHTGLSFELTLKQYDDREAKNDDEPNHITTWLSQVGLEKKLDAHEEDNLNPDHNGVPRILIEPPPLSPEEVANSIRGFDFARSTNNLLAVYGDVSTRSPPRRANSNRQTGLARLNDDLAVSYGYDPEPASSMQSQRSHTFPNTDPQVFFRAIEVGDIATIKRELKNGVRLEMTDEFGRTPLWVAVDIGKRNVIQLLLENGANVEAKNLRGQNVLDWALNKGKQDIVNMIIAIGDAE